MNILSSCLYLDDSVAQRGQSVWEKLFHGWLTHASVAFLLFRWSTVKKNLDKAWLKGATRKDVHQGKVPADIIKIGPQYVLVTTANLPEQIRCRKMFKPLKYQFIFYSLLKVLERVVWWSGPAMAYGKASYYLWYLVTHSGIVVINIRWSTKTRQEGPSSKELHGGKLEKAK